MAQNPVSVIQLNAITQEILDSAITAHKEIGAGLLESVYQHCMGYELKSRNLQIDSNVIVPLHYKGTPLR